MVAAGFLVGCVPAFNWREVRLDEAKIAALFPCSPKHHARNLGAAAAPLPMHLHVCTASGITFALSYLDVPDPAQVAATLPALRNSAITNLSASETARSQLHISGMTPDPSAMSISMLGVSPEGVPIESTVAVFAKGSRAYQATVFGPRVDPELTQTFLAGLRLQ